MCVEGYGFRLRPVTDRDAGFVVELRNTPGLNQYLHAGATGVQEQLAWQARYYDRTDSYYFIVERLTSGSAEGVLGLYDVDRNTATGEWGSWILRPDSLAAVESVYLLYRIAFEQLGLQSLYCRTVAENRKVVSFHDSCGITSCRILPGHYELRGRKYDAVEHRLELATWSTVRTRLERLSQLTARRMSRV
jgi:RimJ/RimL family protein N-acetyltransferase